MACNLPRTRGSALLQFILLIICLVALTGYTDLSTFTHQPTSASTRGVPKHHLPLRIRSSWRCYPEFCNTETENCEAFEMYTTLNRGLLRRNPLHAGDVAHLSERTKGEKKLPVDDSHVGGANQHEVHAHVDDDRVLPNTVAVDDDPKNARQPPDLIQHRGRIYRCHCMSRTPFSREGIMYLFNNQRLSRSQHPAGTGRGVCCTEVTLCMAPACQTPPAACGTVLCRRLNSMSDAEIPTSEARVASSNASDLKAGPSTSNVEYPSIHLLLAILSDVIHQCENQIQRDSYLSNRLYKEALLIIVTLLAISCKFLSESEENERCAVNNTRLRSIVHSFFCNTSNRSDSSSKSDTAAVTASSKIKHSSKANSVLDTLNDYVFRPWLLKSQPVKSDSCTLPPAPSACLSDPVCSSRQNLDRDITTPTSNEVIIQVNPALRYLPDPSHNPAIDLAYLGYRLATLSALPASVPVSRIKLANAGYCYLGQGEEVTCYICSSRHSGWRMEDDPMDIHRNQSPECPHVVERDREAANAVCPITGDFLGTGPDPRGVVTQAGGVPGALSSGMTRTSDSRTVGSTGPLISGLPRTAESAAVGAGAGQHRNGETTSPPRQQGAALLGSHPDEDGEGVPSGQTPATPAYLHPRQATQCQPGGTAATQSLAISGATMAMATADSEAAGAGGSRSHQGGPDAGDRQEASTTNAAGAPNSAHSRISIVPVAGDGATGSTNRTAARAEPRRVFPEARLDLGGAVYPMFQDMASRRRTFSQWDDSQAPPLDAVILSGMFYAGYADCVRCFYCGVGLKHWVVTDDVWTEHVRWRPTCQYLTAVKGPDFITDTQRTLAMTASGQTADTNPTDSANGSSQRPSSQQPQHQQQQQEQQPPVTPNAASAPVTTATVATTAASSAVESSSAARVSDPPQPPPATATTTTTTTAARSLISSTTATPPGTSRRSDNQARSAVESASAARASNLPPPPSPAAAATTAAATGRHAPPCKVCHQAAINTVLMPCGHLVLCETCARSATSCPLCHDSIRATARVLLE